MEYIHSADWNGSNMSMLTRSVGVVAEVTNVQIFLVTLSILVSLFACLGNLLTIIVVYRTPELRTLPNMYIVSLALADFFAGISFPFNILAILPGVEKVLNTCQYRCTLRYAFLHTFLSASFLSMLAISVDRYIYVMYPLRYYVYVSPLRTCLVIMTSWLISIVLGGMLVATSVWKEGCAYFKVLSRSFYLGVCLPFMFSIAVMTAIMYASISWQAIKQRRKIRCKTSCSGEVIGYVAMFRTLKFFFVVYGIFVICWTPAGLMALVGFVKVSDVHVTNATMCIGLLNSGLNFIIYVVMNKHFRKAFGMILGFRSSHRKCCKLMLACRQEAATL